MNSENALFDLLKSWWLESEEDGKAGMVVPALAKATEEVINRA